MRHKLFQQGWRAEGTSPAALARRIQDDTRLYGEVIAQRKITVSGVGGHLSGDYLISRVNHQIGDAGYRQQFSLTRNARSAGAGASPGVPAGVF